MKVSVIIPTYKPGDYFTDCLRSLGAQSLDHSDFEVIIVINGCGEPWLSQVKSLVAQYLPDISTNIIHTETPGVSNARNIGIDAAKSRYITFIDDDDYISETYLQRLAEKEAPETVVFSNSISFLDSDNSFDENYVYRRAYYNVKDSENTTHLRIRRLLNSPCMKLFARECIGDSRFNCNFKLGEDSLLMFEISRNIKNVAFASDDAVYYRRVRENSASTAKRSAGKRIGHQMALLLAFSKSYFRSPFRYNLPFYLSRIVAVTKNMITGS